MAQLRLEKLKTLAVDSHAYTVGAILLVLMGLSLFEPWLTSLQKDLLVDERLIRTIPASFDLCRAWLLIVACLLVLFWKVLSKYPGIHVGKLEVLGLSFFAFFLVVSRTLQYPYCVDDTYIYFRYIRNFASHGIMEYNAGYPVLGFTSHLYIWILAGISWLLKIENLPLLAHNLGLALSFWNYFGILVLLVTMGVESAYAVMGSIMYSVSFYQISQVTYGMESSLLVSLLLFLLLGIQAKRPPWIAAAAVGIFLCRPEGIFVLVLAFIYCCFKRGPNWLLPWLTLSFIVGVYFVWVFSVYGTIVPHTIAAKQSIYSLEPDAALKGIAAFFTQSYLFGVPALPAAISVMVGTLAIGAWFSRNEPSLLLYTGCCLVLIVFFSVSNPLMFTWYFSWFSLLPVLFYPVVISKSASLFKRFRPIPVRICASIVVCWLGLTYLSYPRSPAASSRSDLASPLFYWDSPRQRLILYEEAAKYLSGDSKGNSLVAVTEDGIFGYTYKGPILTLDGLASKEALNYYPLRKDEYFSPFAISPLLITTLKPQYVLFLDAFALNSILRDSLFLGEYKPERFWPLELWGGKGMYIYRSRTMDKEHS